MIVLETTLGSAMTTDVQLWLDDWLTIVGMMVVDMGRTLDISDVVQHVCGERVWRRTGNRVRVLLLCGYIIKLPR